MQETKNFKNIINKYGAITALVILFSVLSGLGVWFFREYRENKTITVTGTSDTKIKNQIATFSLNIEGRNADKATAVKDVSEKSQKVVQQIKDFGIPTEDVQTTNLNVWQQEEPYYEEGTTRYKKADWVANYTINITLRDLDKSDDLTGVLASVDKASMWGPNLAIDNKTIDEDMLLAEALTDARNKAEKLAQAYGKKLGNVVSIIEGGSTGVVSMYYEKSGMGGGGGMPIEPGSTSVSKVVSVTFQLK